MSAKFKPGDWVRDTVDKSVYEFGFVTLVDEASDVVQVDWNQKGTSKWRSFNQWAGHIMLVDKPPSKRIKLSYVKHLIAERASPSP